MMEKSFKYQSLPADELVVGSVPSPGNTNKNAMSSRSRRQKFLRITIVAFVAILLTKVLFARFYHCFRLPTQVHHPHQPLQWESEDDRSADNKIIKSKVALEAHIMSKCPDAKYCLQNLVVPAMEKIHEKVNFTLSFIGQLDPHSDAVTCMHGPAECLGNIIILCARKLYDDPRVHLGYANCLVNDYPKIPERDLVEGCAWEHGIDFSEINRCISDDGGEGMALLRDSVARSSDNNVTKSCTVRLNGEIRCIRDGGKWKDCEDGSSVEDLIRDIEKAYSSSAA